MKAKPPVLSEQQVWDYARRNLDPASKIVQLGTHTHREAQRDADAAYYEPLIQQAKEEVARKIFEDIEKSWGWLAGMWQSDDKIMSIRYSQHQSLKAKYLKG